MSGAFWKTQRIAVAVSLLFAAGPAYAIIGGTEVKPPFVEGEGQTDSPSVFVVRSALGFCTATAISSRAVVTARYCIPEDNVVQMAIGQAVFSLDCGKQSQKSDATLGWAVCQSDGDLPLQRHETFYSGPELPLGSKLSVFGRGCQVRGGVDASLGTLTKGEITLEEYDKVRGLGRALGAQLCPGDGGGPVFVSTGSGGRQLVGVSTRRGSDGSIYFTPVPESEIAALLKKTVHSNSLTCSELNTGFISIPVCTVSNVNAIATSVDDQAIFGNTELFSVDKLVKSQAISVTVRDGETIKEVVERVCGQEPESYFEYFKNKVNIDLDTVLTEQSVEIPLCSDRWYKEIVMPKKTLWDVFMAEPSSSLDGTPIWVGFDVPEGTKLDDPLNARYFVPAFRNLNPGVDPNRIPQGTKVLFPTAPARAKDALPVASFQGDVIPQLSISDEEMDEQGMVCMPPDVSSNYPYSVTELLRALSANYLVTPKRPRGKIKVVSADSGLYGLGQGFLQANAVEMPASQSEEEFATDMKPLFDDEKSAHGTQVASLLLGGSDLISIAGVLPISERVTLVPQRIYEARTYELKNVATNEVTNPRVKVTRAYAFEDVMNAANTFNAKIANLSLKTFLPIADIANRPKDSRMLFVVAAGNGDGDLNSERKKVYPAIYGASPDVIAVAAVDGKGNLAPFSNFGSQYVQIAAPGCEIPVISYDHANSTFFQEKQNGTSLAAPLVSFTAALIASEVNGQIEPSKIKERLLASADFRTGDLRDKVADGRVLNVARSVAVWTDVVQLKNKPSLLIGNVTFLRANKKLGADSILTLKCKDETVSKDIRLKRLRKIAFGYESSGGVDYARVYYDVDSAGMATKSCLLPDNLEVEFDQLSPPLTKRYKLSAIADITTKMF